ncbi:MULTISPECIES: nucleotidyltransferase family protein [Streptomyces]|uniref:nucleotidyltransferase family protein n=1 Tax=Streptomyces TaxID=1883 RepID=UPI002811E480|nr:nucleotidyltransferase family protein [Streptomyces sp.]
MPSRCVVRGARLEPAGRWRVYAPHGLSDVFDLVVRPNPVLAPRDVYEAKAARRRGQWFEPTASDRPAAPAYAPRIAESVVPPHGCR